MPVEPPVVSPSLAGRGLRDPRRRTAPAARRRHGPARPAHRRDRPAARARPRPVAASTSCAGSRVRDGALELGALTTYTRHPRSALCAEHAPGAGRGGRDDRRGPDPEPRHDRRQRDERVAGRRHAAGAARAGRRRSSSAGPAGERVDPGRGVLARLPARRPSRPASSWSGSGSRSSRAGPSGSARSGTRRAQAISKVVVALAWRGGRDPAWRDVRLALGLGRGDADPGRRRRGRPRGRAARRPTPSTRRRGACAASSSRSTTSARPAAYRREVARPGPAAHPGGRGVDVTIGRQPLRQVVDPARQGRPARPTATSPRPDRGRRARGRLRGVVHGRRQRAGRRDRHDEEHRLRVRAGAPHRGDRGVRARARAALPRFAAGRRAGDGLRSASTHGSRLAGDGRPGARRVPCGSAAATRTAVGGRRPVGVVGRRRASRTSSS